jgi:hypothetical protein
MKMRKSTFEIRIDVLAGEFEGEFLAIQFIDAWIEKYGTKSMPTRSQIPMLLSSHPRITSFHFNTRTKIDGIRGDVRRYIYHS